MNRGHVLAVVALITLGLIGAPFLASVSAGRDDSDQDAAAIAKALEERLKDSLTYEGGTRAPEPAPAGYILKVRGGPVPVTISTIRRTSGGVVVYAHFRFTRGSHAAELRGQGLAPGECAWVDRGLNPDEPCDLLFYGFDIKTHFEPRRGAGGPGYETSMEVRSNRGGKTYPWHKDFFLSFSDPTFITEFRVTRSKDARYFVAGLD